MKFKNEQGVPRPFEVWNARLYFDNMSGAKNRPVIDSDNMVDFHSFIRKAAGHFLLFLFNGVFASFAFLSTLFKEKKRSLLLALLLSIVTGFILAGLSELIQAIPALHRGSTWSDVGIDTLGFAIASSDRKSVV